MSEVEPKARGCTSRKVYLEIPQNSEKLHMCWSLFLKLVLYTLFQMHCPKIILSLRSSHWRCSIEKDVFKNFANFTGKHLCWSLFLIKLHAFRPATLLKETPI